MTHNPDSRYLVAEVQVDSRDGCFHAHSKEVPGLHICGSSLEDVLSDLPAAIRHVYKVTKNMDVTVEWAADTSVIDSRVVQENLIARFVMQRTFSAAA